MNTQVRNNGATSCLTAKIGRLAALLLLCGMAAHAQQVFDLSADFSMKNNPNKVWQYGYSETNSLAPDQFRLDKYSDGGSPIGFWHPAATNGPGPGYYPYIAYNTTKQSQAWPSPNGWIVRGGEIAMEASNSGQYSLVRFVAPVTGIYKISGQFAGVHVWSTTDVHVLHNGVSLFDADIDGYGGDPTFRKVQGASPTAAYSGQIEMKANDTVTFAVGYGKNKTNSGDTTGLFARIVLLTETGAIVGVNQATDVAECVVRREVPTCEGGFQVKTHSGLYRQRLSTRLQLLSSEKGDPPAKVAIEQFCNLFGRARLLDLVQRPNDVFVERAAGACDLAHLR